MECRLHAERTGMDKLKSRSSKVRQNIAVSLLIVSDAVAVLSALVLSLRLRFDTMSWPDLSAGYIHNHTTSIAAAVGVYIAVFAAFRLYRYAWRFASLEILWSIILADTIGACSLYGLQYLVEGTTYPLSVFVIFWLLNLAFVGGLRVIMRLASLGQLYGGKAVNILKRDLAPKRVVILGGGSTGARLLAALREDLDSHYQIVGFLDDRADKRGTYIRDAKVIGPLAHLYKLLDDRLVDEVLVAMPEASGAQIKEYVMACRKKKVPVKVFPAVADLLNGRSHPKLEDISVEDLLRRPAVCINTSEVGNLIEGKRILVTGAGGSIGSELCRQILAHNPGKLVLVGHGENSIHQIYSELKHKRPDYADKLHMAIASVSDEVRVEQVFSHYRPHVVFHTAAHKHVPIMETNLHEAVQNNVFGTSCVAGACGRYKVERMVLISTDKAVNPSCVMGATKWFCEEVVRAMAELYASTSYVTVRFGNVLGSRGSVVPIFHEQIKRGGPVTVTHPEMTRYFMSISEAVQLVMEAGAIGQSGELFLLNMGDPIRVAELAQDMIRLCGYEPGVDVEVIYSGPRPGEKMHEQLTTSDEVVSSSICDGLSVVHRPSYFDDETEVLSIVRDLRMLIDESDENQTREFLSDIVPGCAIPPIMRETVTQRHNTQSKGEVVPVKRLDLRE